MAPKSKIRDEAEALRLLRNEGYTYQQMVDFYLEKYGIETSTALWSRFLKKANDGKNARGTANYAEAIPWRTVNHPKKEHLAEALRVFARMDSGEEVPYDQVRRAMSTKQRLVSKNLVIDYDDKTESFTTVPRRAGVDTGWIRDPFLDDDGNLVADFSHVRVEAFMARIESI
ncbi:hypothetical protein [Schaalia sp. ZJ1691]|uniref:hypothetical protein n=1 Tax=Schaalia sp. ZJ1691 TaxID=2709404 RepID=UPI0013EBDAFA|nr:hypothetical protein [Schaalia sp. ZJ1691]